MKNIIDCHTHLQTKHLINEYFQNRDGYAIVLKALDSLIGNGNEIYSAIQNCDKIFLCECIDAFSQLSIKQQLTKIKHNLNSYQIIGIKIYLGYQPIFADDPKFIPVYEFCEKFGLSVVFHCGVGAENLPSEKQINYSSCLPIGKVAKFFPNVNFIVSHFDYPNFEDCLKVITENKNVFTDISGIYENYDETPFEDLITNFVKQLKPRLEKYNIQNVIDKVMFGTDYFGIGSGFDAVEEYIKTLYLLFPQQYENKFLFENCVNAYPKLNKYLKKDK